VFREKDRYLVNSCLCIFHIISPSLFLTTDSIDRFKQHLKASTAVNINRVQQVNFMSIPDNKPHIYGILI